MGNLILFKKRSGDLIKVDTVLKIQTILDTVWRDINQDLVLIIREVLHNDSVESLLKMAMDNGPDRWKDNPNFYQAVVDEIMFRD